MELHTICYDFSDFAVLVDKSVKWSYHLTMLDELKRELAQLYTTPESARLVSDTAGIPATFIDWEGAPVEIWHRIVDQAEKRHKLPDLLRVAIQQYPNRPMLQRIYGVFLYGIRSDKDVEYFDVNSPRGVRPGGELADLQQVADLCRRLEVIIRGSEQYNVEGLVTAVKRVEVKVDTLTAEVAHLGGRQATNRRILIGVSILVICLLVAVGSLVFRTGAIS